MRILKITALITALLFVTACGTNTVESKPTPTNTPMASQVETKVPKEVTISAAALKGPTAVSMIKMIDSLPQLDTNTKVKYEVLSSPEELTAKLVANQVDFATVPTNQAALLYNKTPDYSIVATSIWGVMYVLTNGENIQQVSDLKGKTITTSGKGTTPDIALRYILTANKLDPDKDVTIEYIQEHSEVAQKLIAKQTKIALLPEPFVTTVLTKKPEIKVAIDIQKEWKKASGDAEFPQTCLVVKNKFATENPELVKSFLDEYKKSIDWVNANPMDAGKLVEKNKIGLEPVSVEKSIPRSNIKFVSAEDSKKAVNKFLEVILKSAPKFVGGKMPDDKFFYQK